MSGKQRNPEPTGEQAPKLTPLTDPANLAMHDPERDGDIRDNPQWRRLSGYQPPPKKQ